MIKKVQKGSLLESRELDQVLSIWLESNREAHSFVDPSYWEDHYEAVRTAIKDTSLYIFYEKDKVTAFLGLVERDIAGLFVERESRSKGVGRQLLNRVKQEMLSLTLAVYKKNQPAVRFYSNQGFEIIKEQIENETGEAEFLMQWKSAEASE